MTVDRFVLYRHMLRSRRFEEALNRLWQAGRISGEMHPSLGEEGIAAGVVTALEDGDALALEHRATAPLVVRGVDLFALMAEMLGLKDGLCGGAGGHMHLFSKEHLAASSGIVGAAGPAAVGFALAHERLAPSKVAVAFFGDGAMNQGMLLESLNLAVAWKLPVLFVCKDNGWAITTRSATVTGGDLSERASAFGLHVEEVDGADVVAVAKVAASSVARLRRGRGPTFLRARCVHLEGHFLGDPMVRVLRQPVSEMQRIGEPLLTSAAREEGAPMAERARGMLEITGRIGRFALDQSRRRRDPVSRLRRQLARFGTRLDLLEREVDAEIEAVLARVAEPVVEQARAEPARAQQAGRA